MPSGYKADSHLISGTRKKRGSYALCSHYVAVPTAAICYLQEYTTPYEIYLGTRNVAKSRRDISWHSPSCDVDEFLHCGITGLHPWGCQYQDPSPLSLSQNLTGFLHPKERRRPPCAMSSTADRGHLLNRSTQHTPPFVETATAPVRSKYLANLLYLWMTNYKATVFDSSRIPRLLWLFIPSLLSATRGQEGRSATPRYPRLVADIFAEEGWQR